MTEAPLIFYLSKPEFEDAKESGTLIRHEVFGFDFNSWTCRPGRSVLIKRSWQQRASLQGRIVSYERLNPHFLEIDEAFDFSARNGNIDCDVAVIMVKVGAKKMRAAA